MIFINPDVLSRLDNPQRALLQRTADNAMKCRTLSVTDFARPDITPRNYYSIGRYYHPNPNTPDGMPWISHDGVANPDADLGPKRSLNQIIKNVFALSVAGYFIDKKYSDKAVELLDKWFLDSECGMNPNLDNAQMVPGLNKGRPAGIIDSHTWVNIIVALDFLSVSIENSAFLHGMQNWLRTYADWLMYSDAGISVRHIGNNISAWYAAQLITFSTFAKTADKYISQCIDIFKWLIREHMDTSGCFYGELRRTRSLHYCMFHLNAMALIATVASHLGTDLWHWHDNTGKGLENAFDFLRPFISGEQHWPYPQIRTEMFPEQFSFYMAAEQYKRTELSDINKKIPNKADFGNILGPSWLWSGL